jgi:hypothetical protein
MHTCLVAFAFVVALAGTAHAQSVTCRDGTVLTGVNAQRMCVAHGGLPPEAYAPLNTNLPRSGYKLGAGRSGRRWWPGPGMGQ